MKKFGKLISHITKVLLTLTVFILVPFVAITLVSSNTDIIPNVKSYIVVSGSMEPAISTGSVIYTIKKEIYKKGDVIAFEQDGRVVTHRIVNIENGGSEPLFVTKGDANNVEDGSPVRESNVVGTTLFHLPFVGYSISFFKTPLGFVIGIILPALFLIGMELWNIKREIEKQTEKRIIKQMRTIE